MVDFVEYEHTPFYSLTCMPELRFNNLEVNTAVKIKKYIETKINEINQLEKKYYADIIDHIQYDYNYYFKYILPYNEYYRIINSIATFNPDLDTRVKIPSCLGTHKKQRIIDNADTIQSILDILEIHRNRKLKNIKDFSKKNKLSIQSKMIE